GDGIGDRERGDDPGPLAGADAQVARNGGDGDVGDRGVQRIHEHRGRQRDRADDAGRALERRRGAAGGLGTGGGAHDARLARMILAISASASAWVSLNALVDQAGSWRCGSGASWSPSWLTSTSTSIDRPTRSGCAFSSSGSSSMRTGTRCTTLIQLPVAFCAGRSAKALPVPASSPTTVPW